MFLILEEKLQVESELTYSNLFSYFDVKWFKKKI